MKFKLDENFGTRTQQLFRNAGHDVATVWEESLQGCTDQEIYEVCCTEKRCLVTLDLDFANVVRFPPEGTAGIAVIRVPHNPSLSLLEQLISKFLDALTPLSINQQFWIVEPGRIRVHSANT